MGLTHEELTAYDADIILVAPCGMDRQRATSDGEQMWRHQWWRELRAVKDGQVRDAAREQKYRSCLYPQRENVHEHSARL